MLTSSRGTNSYLVDLKTSVFDEIAFESEDVKCKIHAKDIEENFKITIVPKDSKLYQGAVYQFKTGVSNKNIASDYYKNYYDTRHNGAYFVSSREVADRYGKKQDESRIVYAAVPDAENQTQNQQFLYPICYIPGIRGSRVTYLTKAHLKLLDISDIHCVRILWDITEQMTPEKKKDSQSILINTIVDAAQYYDDSPKKSNSHWRKWFGLKVDSDRNPPSKLNRVSKEWFDEELVEFFKNEVIPYVKRVYGQTLHGYIYKQMEGNSFHDEIMLLDRKLLKFLNVESDPPTEYPGLVSVEEWKKQHDTSKVENTEVLKKAITLIPAINMPYRKQ
jgi:hypothetical protein